MRLYQLAVFKLLLFEQGYEPLGNSNNKIDGNTLEFIKKGDRYNFLVEFNSGLRSTATWEYNKLVMHQYKGVGVHLNTLFKTDLVGNLEDKKILDCVNYLIHLENKFND